MNQATTEKHVVMNAQLLLARKILSENYNSTIDSRDVVINGGQLICKIHQKNIPNDGINFLNGELDAVISSHPDSKIRNNSVRVEFN